MMSLFDWIFLCLCLTFLWLWGKDIVAYWILHYSDPELKVGTEIRVKEHGQGSLIHKNSRTLVLLSTTGHRIHVPFYEVLRKGYILLDNLEVKHACLDVKIPTHLLATSKQLVLKHLMLFPGIALNQRPALKRINTSDQVHYAQLEILVPLLHPDEEEHLLEYLRLFPLPEIEISGRGNRRQ